MDWSSLEFGWRVVLAIVAGGVANFMLGALWYALLFQKAWIQSTGRTAEEIHSSGGPGATMALTLLGTLSTTLVLAIIFQWVGGSTVLDGLVIGLLLGVGISFWERFKTAVYNVDDKVHVWAMFRIDAAYNVCGLAVAGMVYALIA